MPEEGMNSHLHLPHVIKSTKPHQLSPYILLSLIINQPPSLIYSCEHVVLFWCGNYETLKGNAKVGEHEMISSV